MTLQDGRNMYQEIFGECFCCGFEETTGTKDEYDDAIAECNAMIDYSIDQKDEKEVAYFRKLLQELKMQKRRAVNL